MLQQLDIYANKLSGRIPSEIGMLKQLTYLLLTLNCLTGIVPALPFTQYSNYCKLCWWPACTMDSNRFECPLPAGFENCQNDGTPYCVNVTPTSCTRH
jgi:hypothetical protein